MRMSLSLPFLFKKTPSFLRKEERLKGSIFFPLFPLSLSFFVTLLSVRTLSLFPLLVDEELGRERERRERERREGEERERRERERETTQKKVMARVRKEKKKEKKVFLTR